MVALDSLLTMFLFAVRGDAVVRYRHLLRYAALAYEAKLGISIDLKGVAKQIARLLVVARMSPRHRHVIANHQDEKGGRPETTILQY